MEHHPDDDWLYDDDEDGGPEFEFDCGMLPDGTCMYAGSEDCEWDCPYRG